MADARETVVLKKYGNRRLYDTRASHYVTLVEVEKMLVAGDDIEVVDAKTGEDLTKEILVQVIAEKPGAKDALPLSFLKEVVRLGSGPARHQFADALSSTLGAVLETQKQVASEMQRAATAYAQTPFMNPFAMFFRPPAHVSAPPPPLPAPAPSLEMDALRRELDATRAMIQELAQDRRADAASAKEQRPPRAKRAAPAPAPRRKKRTGSAAERS